MSFQALYFFAATIISLTGLFFFILGIRQLISRRFGLTWKSLLREAWHEVLGNRQASGRGTGLYFALFGLFMILFCTGVSVMLRLTWMVMPQDGSPLPSPLSVAEGSSENQWR